MNIEDANSDFINAVAHIDTECDFGNRASLALVEDLGQAGKISHIDDAPSIWQCRQSLLFLVALCPPCEIGVPVAPK